MALVDKAPHNMTAPALPTPVVASDSSHYDGTVAAWLAFDGTNTGRWLTTTLPSVSVPQWVQIDLGSGNAAAITQFAIASDASDPSTRNIMNFTLQGSNDNLTWTIVATVANAVNWTPSEVRTYPTADTSVAYRYFRVVITANNGDTQVSIGEIYLYTGYAAPTSPDTLSLLQDRYVKRKLGAFIHFGMETFLGSDGFGTGSEALSTFNPTIIDVEGWLDTYVSLGMRYAILTVKHVNGFCLWPTGATSRNISGTPYGQAGGIDVVRRFVNGCRERNISPMFYFAIGDLTADAALGTLVSGNAVARTRYVEQMLHELLSNYGPIDGIWFDAWNYWYTNGTTYIPYATIHDFIKAHQPNCLVIDNEHLGISSGTLAGTDICTTEDGVTVCTPPTTANTYPCELALKNTTYWFWCPGMSLTHSRQLLLQDYDQFVSGYGSMAVNCTPTRAGTLDPVQVQALHDFVNILRNRSITYGGVATASSFFDTGGASTPPQAAISGEPSGFWTTSAGSGILNFYSSASGDTTPWWQVDLGSMQFINQIVIFNRQGVTGRLRDITVQILANDGSTVLWTSPTLNPHNVLGGGISDYESNDGPTELSAVAGITGRFIKISRAAEGSSDDQCNLQIQQLWVGNPYSPPAPSQPQRLHPWIL
jgi:alpha-L-fucosidase